MTDRDAHEEEVGRDEELVGAWTGTPRWVRISVIVTGLVVILLVILLLFGGDHGPRVHAP